MEHIYPLMEALPGPEITVETAVLVVEVDMVVMVVPALMAEAEVEVGEDPLHHRPVIMEIPVVMVAVEALTEEAEALVEEVEVMGMLHILEALVELEDLVEHMVDLVAQVDLEDTEMFRQIVEVPDLKGLTPKVWI